MAFICNMLYMVKLLAPPNIPNLNDSETCGSHMLEEPLGSKA